jgi:hypothetical protein
MGNAHPPDVERVEDDAQAHRDGRQTQDVRGGGRGGGPGPARADRARELFQAPRVENDFHADVILHEDLAGNGEWRVEYQDDDGAMYATAFSGPVAGRRARDYFEALTAGALKTLRDGPSEH